LGLQWNGNRAWKERTRKSRIEMKRRGPRIALGKVKRRGLHYPSLVKIVVLFFFPLIFNSVL